MHGGTVDARRDGTNKLQLNVYLGILVYYKRMYYFVRIEMKT